MRVKRPISQHDQLVALLAQIAVANYVHEQAAEAEPPEPEPEERPKVKDGTA